MDGLTEAGGPGSSYDLIKRLSDILLALLGLALVSPLLAIAALIIKIDSRGPVLFKQVRIGRNFAPFTVYKLRTMVDDLGAPGLAAAHKQRVTRVGAALRRTKLDEIPQLINVVMGEMSLVGPRPEIPAYVELFKKDYELILTVKPGMTDFAAIQFKDEEQLLSGCVDAATTYIAEILPAKIELYKMYLRERGLLTDFKLMLLTVRKLLG